MGQTKVTHPDARNRSDVFPLHYVRLIIRWHIPGSPSEPPLHLRIGVKYSPIHNTRAQHLRVPLSVLSSSLMRLRTSSS